jgi:periplasmic divalent cation tolerance protein
MEVGKEIARRLVSERLAACVNILPGITSIYTWDGKMNEDQELLCLVKTRKDLFPPLEAAVKEIHPYDVPEIISVQVQQGSKPYLEWIDSSTMPVSAL